MIVMKFGGTSVEDAGAIERVAAHRARTPCRKSPSSWSAPWRRSPTSAGHGPRRRKRRPQDRAANSAALCASATTTPPASCWAPRASPNCTPSWAPISTPSTNCCAASPPSANSLRAPTDHVAAFGEMLSSKIVAAAFAARGLNADARRLARGDDHRRQHTCRPFRNLKRPIQRF